MQMTATGGVAMARCETEGVVVEVVLVVDGGGGEMFRAHVKARDDVNLELFTTPSTINIHEQWVSQTLKRSCARVEIRQKSDRAITTARADSETRNVKLAEKMRDTGTSDGGATMRAMMRNDDGDDGIVIAATLHPDLLLRT